MSKYTRSMEKLTQLLKDIFSTDDISDDTKAIALVLAATMSSAKYKTFLRPIDELGVIKDKLIQVNTMRCQNGKIFRDYIVLNVLKQSSSQVSSDELQQYILNADSTSNEPQTAQLSQALLPEEFDPIAAPAWQQHTDAKDFASIMHKAVDFLVNKLTGNSTDQIAMIIETYVHCRLKTKPIVAYYATIYAIEHILIEGGIDTKKSLLCSYKLAKHALDKFINDSMHKNEILPIYKSLASFSS